MSDESVRAVVLPVLERIAAGAGLVVPRLVVINRRGWMPRAMGVVARTRVRGGAGSVIGVSSEAVADLSAPALEFLLAHEFGHIVLRRSRWIRARLACGVVLFFLGSLIVAAAVFLPVVGTVVMVVLMAAVFATLGAGQYVLRRHEEEADDYAAAYQGDLRGAEELFRWLALRRGKPQAEMGAMTRLLASHPHPLDRLERLARKRKDRTRDGLA